MDWVQLSTGDPREQNGESNLRLLTVNTIRRIEKMSTQSNCNQRKSQGQDKAEGILAKRRPEVINIKRHLQIALRRGLAIVEKAWSHHTGDYVTSFHAVDLDGDGNTEVIVGLHNGRLRVLTESETQKWEKTLGNGKWLCTVTGVPRIEEEYLVALSEEMRVCVLAGSLDGYVYGLNQRGDEIWKYDVGGIVRQVYVNPECPDEVMISSENGYIHALDRQSKRLLWPLYQAYGVIHCLLSYDIDEDGEIELLVATDDRHICVLDSQGQHKDDLFTDYKIYSLFVGRLEGKAALIASTSNGIVQMQTRRNLVM
jgi:outer membrane protein assembly factor BamB